MPPIEPALSEPQVLEGFNAKGVPQLRAAKSPVTLRRLLTHTAGFTYRLWDDKALRYVEAIGKMPPAARGKLPRTPLMFDPGTRWQYGPNIDWVGKIVEHVSGEPVDAYFRKHILGPLGMNDTGFTIAPEQRAREASAHRREADGSLRALPPEKQRASAIFTGGGGIYSTAPDYLTFLRMLMQGGTLAGVRILRPETVAMMDRNQIGDVDVHPLRTTAPAFSSDVDLFPGITCKWGLGHMLTMQAVAGGRSAGSMTWGGLYNTYYWIDPVRRLAAVFMTQVMPFADARALRLYHAYERGLYAPDEELARTRRRRHEFQRHAVHAVAQAGRPWAVIEHVAEVAAATPARNRGAGHAERRSLISSTALSSGAQKLGQPVPLSYLVFDE